MAPTKTPAADLEALRASGQLFVNANEAAPFFDTDARTLCAALARGDIPGAFRLGQRWRIPVATIVKLAGGAA